MVTTPSCPAMALSSTTWAGHRCFPLSEENWSTNSLLVSRLRSLATVSNEIRHRNDCLTNTKIFERGREHVVFELIFNDGVEWVARFPLPHHLLGRTTEELQSEIVTIQFLCIHSNLPIPWIHEYNLD